MTNIPSNSTPAKSPMTLEEAAQMVLDLEYMLWCDFNEKYGTKEVNDPRRLVLTNLSNALLSAKSASVQTVTEEMVERLRNEVGKRCEFWLPLWEARAMLEHVLSAPSPAKEETKAECHTVCNKCGAHGEPHETYCGRVQTSGICDGEMIGDTPKAEPASDEDTRELGAPQ